MVLPASPCFCLTFRETSRLRATLSHERASAPLPHYTPVPKSIPVARSSTLLPPQLCSHTRCSPTAQSRVSLRRNAVVRCFNHIKSVCVFWFDCVTYSSIAWPPAVCDPTNRRSWLAATEEPRAKETQRKSIANSLGTHSTRRSLFYCCDIHTHMAMCTPSQLCSRPLHMGQIFSRRNFLGKHPELYSSHMEAYTWRQTARSRVHGYGDRLLTIGVMTGWPQFLAERFRNFGVELTDEDLGGKFHIDRVYVQGGWVWPVAFGSTANTKYNAPPARQIIARFSYLSKQARCFPVQLATYHVEWRHTWLRLRHTTLRRCFR